MHATIAPMTGILMTFISGGNPAMRCRMFMIISPFLKTLRLRHKKRRSCTTLVAHAGGQPIELSHLKCRQFVKRFIFGSIFFSGHDGLVGKAHFLRCKSLKVARNGHAAVVALCPFLWHFAGMTWCPI